MFTEQEVICALRKFQAIYTRLCIIDDESIFVEILNEFYTELITNPILKQIFLKLQPPSHLQISVNFQLPKFYQ